jgi:hypothetical protein
MKKNNILGEMLKKIPLKTRIKVANEAAFIILLSELGYRDGYWMPEEDEKLKKLSKLAEEHTNNILELIEEYKKDNKS